MKEQYITAKEAVAKVKKYTGIEDDEQLASKVGLPLPALKLWQNGSYENTRVYKTLVGAVKRELGLDETFFLEEGSPQARKPKSAAKKKARKENKPAKERTSNKERTIYRRDPKGERMVAREAIQKLKDYTGIEDDKEFAEKSGIPETAVMLYLHGSFGDKLNYNIIISCAKENLGISEDFFRKSPDEPVRKPLALAKSEKAAGEDAAEDSKKLHEFLKWYNSDEKHSAKEIREGIKRMLID